MKQRKDAGQERNEKEKGEIALPLPKEGEEGAIITPLIAPYNVKKEENKKACRKKRRDIGGPFPLHVWYLSCILKEFNGNANHLSIVVSCQHVYTNLF